MDQGDGKPAKDDPPGQRRQVTVLFADVADFTPLAERLGEEDRAGWPPTFAAVQFVRSLPPAA